jgi:hypothetical protein
MLLPTARLATRDLTWDAPTRRFVAEASELRVSASRVWDDACDLGYTLVGRDARMVPVVVNDEPRDAEGDLLYTDYAPLFPKDRQTFAGLRVFND